MVNCICVTNKFVPQNDKNGWMMVMVKVPHLPPGDYVLGWRWDCEESTQVKMMIMMRKSGGIVQYKFHISIKAKISSVMDNFSTVFVLQSKNE